MRVSSWRPAFRAFVDARVSISSWLLDRPDTYGDVTGFLPPLREVDYRVRDNGKVDLTATQDFIISQRHPSDLSYKDLPIDVLEGYYTTLAIAFVATYQSIHPDLFNLTFNQVEQPIAISEISEDNNDWIADIKWSLRIEATVEPEVGTTIEPFDLKAIDAHIWRDSLKDDLLDSISDPTLRVLDFTKIWEYTTVNGKSVQTL